MVAKFGVHRGRTSYRDAVEVKECGYVEALAAVVALLEEHLESEKADQCPA